MLTVADHFVVSATVGLCEAVILAAAMQTVEIEVFKECHILLGSKDSLYIFEIFLLGLGTGFKHIAVALFFLSLCGFSLGLTLGSGILVELVELGTLGVGDTKSGKGIHGLVAFILFVLLIYGSNTLFFLCILCKGAYGCRCGEDSHEGKCKEFLFHVVSFIKGMFSDCMTIIGPFASLTRKSVIRYIGYSILTDI